ncbi:antibiotic biosynthesis monooxygenase [Aquirufa ecclesiirivi]|uniref:Antibiotic biosynthesis monooxygenase n=1 Tax=Aquirufa ecclesiirivi TaxID=2715124 RepID=A0ABT4JHP8_9BACT|nr:antibiotic biosynthesis monooxygenase [Aquirufa ecclesiirivi]MCZ2475795.1 antibiotic biosynthesis monooxygenase [Aquirufa ecclesiirivi]
MNYVLIIHEVADYASWKKQFDRAANLRKAAGEISFQVLQFQHEPNKVVHFSHWEDIEKAKSFFDSPEVKQIRLDAGVKTPEFNYLKQVDSGIL